VPAVVQDLLLLPRPLVRVDADQWACWVASSSRWRCCTPGKQTGEGKEQQASTQVLGGLTRQQQPQRYAPQVRLKAQC